MGDELDDADEGDGEFGPELYLPWLVNPMMERNDMYAPTEKNK